MTELTVPEAAEHLSVHQSRVRELLHAGTLIGRRVGRQWVIRTDDLDRHRELVRGGATSRAMSARTAWAAGALLDGQGTDWLASSERSRLKARLFQHAAEVVTFRRWLSTRQTGTVRLRIADADIAAFLREPGVVATGISAAHSHGLRLSAVGEAEAYVIAAVAEKLTKAYFLIASERGNLLLRTVDGTWHTDTAVERDGRLVTNRLMTAVDLLDSSDARSATAGRELLRQALQSLNADDAGRA
jgi:excisionase family DNA binding protein